MQRRAFLTSLAALPVLAAPGVATARTATPGTLAGIIAGMPQGGEILLEGGDYGGVRLEGVWPAASPLVLRSQDPGNPARLRELMVINARHVRLEQLVFDYRFRTGDVSYTRPFQIRDSADAAILGSLFDGDVAGPGADVTHGFATGFGLSVRAARRISIIGNEFRRFGRALICDDIEDMVIRGNDFHSLRSDGMNCVAVRGLAIEGNHLHDFARDLQSGDHADMIQFWTARAVARTERVRIRGNLLNAGTGGWTQSIFMRNEMVDTGQAGQGMYYRDLEISNNVVLNAHLHGITVGETRGLTIANNTLVRNAAALGQTDASRVWEPQINVKDVSRDVVIARNVSGGVSGYAGQADWRVRDNITVQDRARSEPGFYLTVFDRAALTDPTRPGSFAPRPGGPLDGTGIGATWLDAAVTGPPTRF